LVDRLTEAGQHLGSLRTVQVLGRLRGGSAPAAANRPGAGQTDRTVRVVAKLLENLNRLNEERSSSLVLVYLPTLSELYADDANFWSKTLDRQSQALGIRFVNLVEEFKRLPYEEGRTLYPPSDSGHFNIKGNEYVAKLIYRSLRSHPDTSRIPLTRDMH
jgi:lysophospholipase L1-like esterase